MTTNEPAVETAHRKRPERSVPISVNNKPVKIGGHRASGLEIKTVAIEQGVAIEPDFQLALVTEDGKLKIVGDHDVVELSSDAKFVATASDDNS